MTKAKHTPGPWQAKNWRVCYGNYIDDSLNAEKRRIEMTEKPVGRLWRREAETPEGKYLVKRRDGTVVEWPNLVIGAKDPAAPAALIAYADKAEKLGMNPQYVEDMRWLAGEFERYRLEHGEGDPDRGRHRIDDPATIAEMRGAVGS